MHAPQNNYENASAQRLCRACIATIHETSARITFEFPIVLLDLIGASEGSRDKLDAGCCRFFGVNGV